MHRTDFREAPSIGTLSPGSLSERTSTGWGHRYHGRSRARTEQDRNATLESLGHQYFMPLQLSLFLCKLLDCQMGKGWQPHPSPGCPLLQPCHGPTAWPWLGPSSPLVCTAGHSPVLDSGGHGGSQRPGRCAGRLTGRRTSWREGPARHFSARLCSWRFSAQRACEAGRAGLRAPARR